MERGQLAAVPEAWRGPLHALNALRRPGQPADQRPTLVVGARWIAPGRAGPIPWAQLRASGLRVVATGLRSRAEVADWMAIGVDGVGGDRPDVLVAALAALDGDGGRLGGGPGQPTPERMEVRSFAGARGLRPESTLAGVEAALDVGATAIELPARLTRDGRVVPALDPTVRPAKHLSLDGGRSWPRGLLVEGPALVSLSLAELRARYDRGVLLPGQPAQSLDSAASPVATGFARARGWTGPHAYVCLAEIIAFLRVYEDHHARGQGRLVPDAASRARGAARVRLVVGLPPGAEGIATGRAAWEVARGAGVIERLTFAAAEPHTLTVLHREAPPVALALELP
jgi:hypothetical protein